MSVSRKDELLRTEAELSELLATALRGMYRMSGEDAEALVREAYRSYLVAREPAGEDAMWVIGATLKSAETLERMHRPPGGPDDAAAELAKHRNLTLTRELVETLPPQARQAVRLRTEGGKSYAEIAAELGVSARYAERLILVSMARLAARRRGQSTKE